MGMLEAIKRGFGVASKNLALVLVLFVFNLIWNMINLAFMPAGATAAPTAGATTIPAIPPEAVLSTLAISVLFIFVSIFMQGGSSQFKHVTGISSPFPRGMTLIRPRLGLPT